MREAKMRSLNVDISFFAEENQIKHVVANQLFEMPQKYVGGWRSALNPAESSQFVSLSPDKVEEAGEEETEPWMNGLAMSCICSNDAKMWLRKLIN